MPDGFKFPPNFGFSASAGRFAKGGRVMGRARSVTDGGGDDLSHPLSSSPVVSTARTGRLPFRAPSGKKR